MQTLREAVEQRDPDPVVIAVLTGSQARGLALSLWTSLEGPAAEAQAIELMNYARTAPPI